MSPKRNRPIRPSSLSSRQSGQRHRGWLRRWRCGLLPRLLLLLPLAPALAGIAGTTPTATAADDIPVLEVSRLTTLDTLLERLADRRVVYVGEVHDRYEDHLSQFAIIRGLHQQGAPLAIGMEFFQQPFQEVLDDYVAGRIDEAEMLRRSEYFERWRFDYRLYRPLLTYAHTHGLPVIALNLPTELTRKVGAGGLEALNEIERAQLPTSIDRSDAEYRAHLEAIFAQHPQGPDADFERFLEVQLLWDEGMAERAATFLQTHPDHRLVVLAGAGHIEYGRGIPNRLARRLAVPAATVLNGSQRLVTPDLADFLLFPRAVSLPASGLLGVMLETGAEGAGIGVQGFAEVSGARDAGIETGDRIVQIGTTEIARYADIRIALLDSSPGDTLPVGVLRKARRGRQEERLDFEVRLH
ncbi:MAG: PDZ domain-containing protein [Chromatiaceae bacterium]|nr:MAG: PDZ domain-containing protein [Chromatiaceae bacterium]